MRGLELALRLHAGALCAHALSGRDALDSALALALAHSLSDRRAARSAGIYQLLALALVDFMGLELALRLHSGTSLAPALSGRDVLGRALALALAVSPSKILEAHRTSLELGVVGPRARGPVTDLRHGGQDSVSCSDFLLVARLLGPRPAGVCFKCLCFLRNIHYRYIIVPE